MLVELIHNTQDPEKAVAIAARLCYFPEKIEELKESLSEKQVTRMVKKILKLGHFSVLEHAVFTFAIEGISRACTHQLVRHRIASFAQQSQRYVSFEHPFEYYTPLSVKKTPELNQEYDVLMNHIHDFYSKLIQNGVEPEDARNVLPNACHSKIIVTMNARALYNFFELRTCLRAQTEIRKMANEMLRLCVKSAPVLFEKAGPPCIRHGACNEGEVDCPFYKKFISGESLQEVKVKL